MKNAITTLRPDQPKDELAAGIWVIKIGKIVLNLWRIRWGNLPTKDRLLKRGMTIDENCNLCGRELETTNHLFFGCEFSQWVHMEAMEAAGALVKTEH